MDSLQERIANLSPEKRALFMERLKQSGAQKTSTPITIERQPRGADPLPLSFGQQRLWFLDQFEAGNAVYNIPVAYEIHGALNIEAFRRAINEIMRRHEVLRSTFDAVDGLPVLHIHPDLSLNVPLIDVTDQPDIQRRMSEEAQRPFDLSTDSPLRVSLLRLTETHHIMLLTLHHIASDGWSFGVLNRELAALYDAYVDSAESPLPDLAVQYADYAAWQRESLQGAALDSQLAHWRTHLSGAPVILELPTDRPRPPIQTYHGAILPLVLPADLTARLKAISKQEGVTLFMTLLAGFKTLLARYTGQYDVCVGSPIANRTQAEIEPLIGFFVNTLALRTPLSPEATFRAAVHQVKETALGAYSHQTMPFEKLVEELQPERNPSHHPLFQVLFALQNQPGHDLALRGLDVRQIEVEATTSKFDLSLYAWEADSGIEGFLEYNTDLFDPATMQRFIGHFETLLAGACADPDARLCDLPMLTTPEMRELLIDWNDTRADYPRDVCIPDLIEAQAAKTPDAVAVRFADQHLTYRELDRRANQLAHHLQAFGAAPDQLVGICVDRSLEMVVSLLGVLKAGAAYVPIDPALPKDRIAFMLEDAAPAVLITQSNLAGALPDFAGHLLCLDIDAPTITTKPIIAPPRAVQPDHLMYVIYTSGSTGKPKGVQIPHRAVVNFMESMRHEPALYAEDVLLSVTTLSFDIAALEIYLPLIVGAQVVLVSREVAADGPALIEALGNARATVMQATPATWRLLLESGWQGDRRLRALCGGEALPRDLADQLLACCAELWNLYGPTETTIWSCCHRVTADQAGAAVSIGRPIVNTQLYVLDANRRPTPIGVPGELYIGGDGLARGYLNRAELTAEKYVASPFIDGERLYRTGDLVRYRADGSLDFVGRIDHQVKIRGFRIELGEIESLLIQHPTVQKAVTIVREDTPGDKRLAAYVVAEHNAGISISDLRAHLKAALPDYMIPAAFVTLDALPLTPNGKIDRRALPVPDQNRATSEELIMPRNEQEARIAGIWSEVLGIDPIGIDDNFFDLGGESFKAVRAVRRIGDSISVMDLFKYPTIRQLAERLDQHQAKPAGLLHELTPQIPTSQRQLSLICVPFAGGGAISYQPVARLMHKGISLYAVEMPGHDYSRRDEPLDGLESIAQKVVTEIQRDLTGQVALLGHCLGGALTVAIARELEQRGIEIEGIFIGGHFPLPRLPGKFFELMRRLFPMEKWTARRTALEFLRAMGFFTEVTDPNEQEFVIRNFLHDARETEDYYTRIYADPTLVPLKAPICCIIGEMDRATELYEERYREWEAFSDTVNMALIPKAGHYFLKHQADQVADIIAGQVETWREDNAAQSTPRRIFKPDWRARAAEPRLSIFYLIAIGQLVSMIGTGLTSFALGIWVFQQTGLISAFAFISVFALLPGIVLAPIAGAVADRFDRRKIMIGADLLAAISTIMVAALLLTGSLQIWHIYISASIAAIANAFQQPAYLAAVTQLTPKRYYGRANGIVQLGSAFGMLLAPLLGGMLTGLIGLHGVVAIDFVTFLFAVTVTLLVRFPNTLFKKREEPFLKEVTGGWRYIVKRHGLMAIIVFTTFINYLFAVMEVLVTPLVLSFGSTVALGGILAANGIGLLAGSVLMSVWGGAKRRTEGIIFGVIAFGVSVFIIGLGSSPIFPALGLLGVGFSIALINAHWLSIVQTKVGLELQGRVMATNLMMVWAMMPLGYLTAGPLADRVFEPLMAADGLLANSIGALIGVGAGRGVGLMMILAGLGAVLLAVLALRYRPIRFLEDILPDALADTVIEYDKDQMQAAANRRLAQPSA